LVIELQIGKRYVADDGIDPVLRQPRVPEILDANVMVGMNRFGDPAGDRVHFDPDETCSGPAVTHEVASAASRFQNRGICGQTQTGDARMDCRDDGGRCVERIECRALGAVVLRRRQQRGEFLAQGLPSGVFEFAGNWIGEDREGNGTESAEAGKGCFFLGSRGPLLFLDCLESADGRDDVACFGVLAAGENDFGMCCFEGECGGFSN